MSDDAHGRETGSRHWRWQRATSVLLIPLALWLAPSLIVLSSAPHAQASEWLGRPLNALLVWVFLATICLHAALGVRVVLEDYVAHAPTRDGAVKAVNILMIVLAVLATAVLVAA